MLAAHSLNRRFDEARPALSNPEKLSPQAGSRSSERLRRSSHVEDGKPRSARRLAYESSNDWSGDYERWGRIPVERGGQSPARYCRQARVPQAAGRTRYIRLVILWRGRDDGLYWRSREPTASCRSLSESRTVAGHEHPP